MAELEQGAIAGVRIRKAITRAGGPVSLLAAAGSFIIDIIAPLGNFAPWVALVSLAAAVICLYWFMRLFRRQGHQAWDSLPAGLLVVSVASTIIFGVWTVLLAVGPPRGYLATNVDPLAQLQTQLLGLRQDVRDIKQTNLNTANQVSAAATAQAEGFANLQAEFASLQAGQGNLVASPRTPQEWYSNARLYQLRGDTSNALKAYEAYLGFHLDYVDPVFAYADLLQATAGITHARDTVTALSTSNPDSNSLYLAATRLLDSPQERLQRLVSLSARAPEYGPVWYELGLEYGRALTANVTRDLLSKESNAYSTLFQVEGEQGFTRYFIDKALAEQELADAHRSYDGYAKAAQTFGQVDIQLYQYFDGVQFIVILPEAYNARQLLFSIDDPAPKTDTGKVTAGSMTVVNTSVGRIKLPVGDHTVYVQYVDANGVTSPVYNKSFHVSPISVMFQQQPPDFSTNTIPGVFVVGVVGAAITDPFTYDYSLDSSALDQHLSEFAQAAISVTGLKTGDHVLNIRATGADGKATETVQFPFTVK